MIMLEELLRWYVEAGADEAIGDEPVSRVAPPEPPRVHDSIAPEPVPPASIRHEPVPAEPAQRPALPPLAAARPSTPGGDTLAAAIETARQRAAAAATLADLERAVAAFDGCALRKTAMRTVFADGNPAADLMLIGEGPGAEEDRQGLPFVGPSGKLLDRMLGAIGRDRRSAYITNVVFWRPPGNRAPTPAEIDVCRPFVERHIELLNPRVLVLVGGVASAALVAGSPGITRLRGRWFTLAINGADHPIQTVAMYHPSFLLRAPERKREAWSDLLSIKSKLETMAK
jgi:DNA polymerase